MSLRLLTLFACWLLCLPVAVHAQAPSEATATPRELRSTSGGKVWVYLPESASDAKTKLPCILIAPAGSRLFHGMALGSGDEAEHLPWVAAGFAVVSYDLSGPLTEEAGDRQILQATEAFMKAKFGVNDGLAALDAALVKYPQIDPARVYVVGHSSAATLSLQLAAASNRFKGCVAFAPVIDVTGHLKEALSVLNSAVPGLFKAMRAASPANRAEAIQCPVFLFRAEDDESNPQATALAYRDALLAAHKTVEYVTVPSGGHYGSMIEQGVPRAIAWVKALDKQQAKP